MPASTRCTRPSTATAPCVRPAIPRTAVTRAALHHKAEAGAGRMAAGRSAEAVDHLLELFRRNRDWNAGAAKTQLFTIFDSLKANDPIVLHGRRKLSSMIFA